MLPQTALVIPTLLIAQFSPKSECLRYIGIAPFDEFEPFEASITENGVVTCWISETYHKHDRMQRAKPVQPDSEMEWEFQPWEFECLEGYKAFANIGRRMISYRVHGRTINWLTEVKEDLLGERYLYWKEKFCEQG